MKLILDTHLLLWALAGSTRLSASARRLIADPSNELIFSVVSIWEIAIKHGKGLTSFRSEPGLIRSAALLNQYTELDIQGAHVLAVPNLPPIHKDPFDRLLIAQAMVEGITLLTADPVIARYPGPIRKV
jgi:PIN domain nuclease of toxin-antitoxin system